MSDSHLSQLCNECGKELPLYEFYFSPTRGAHIHKCKECTKIRRKPWYKKDPNIALSRWKKKKSWRG